MRGRLVSVQQLAIAFGISVSYWIGYGFLDVDSTASWRYCKLRLSMGLKSSIFKADFYESNKLIQKPIDYL